jgi:hypothetical protein
MADLSKINPECPNCGGKLVRVEVESSKVMYKKLQDGGTELTKGSITYYECDSCKSRFANDYDEDVPNLDEELDAEGILSELFIDE